ncbi:Wzz/FepE/Etk N-terminal domain-containing protein [Rhizobiaceae bacterium n13]|uniref:Wzz/FepE/Etk N-terminal domain-containing protein n=1 Tax=Ferirhizobium litorale TaxID=2927786 RepID=A0AAE3U2F2_9HYPH|nr:Wzz/FepE/Etk N-terminal domain-containing protein [Fererhizobium litorale]MDI7862981.1 Wzz/FepE/Etk N-terminal domain-containing protein [Fererhizobium litorale]MDI7924054.1 Wzz/FepE/Etk N-terminal domain-containing protein [Fererhizobium litorale]
MMFNRPRPIDVTSRLWRVNETQPDVSGDGPIALLRALIALGRRHSLSLAVCIGAGLLFAAIYAYSLPPTYKATATLLLEPRQSAVSGGEFGAQQILDLNRADSELQTIKSERLLSAVFGALDLGKNPELGPQKPGLTGSLLGGIRSILGSGDGGGTERSASADGGADQQLLNEADHAAFLNFTKRLSARRVGQSFVIEIEYSSSDPTLPARVANATVSGYIYQTVAFKEQTARAGTEALQGRLDSLATQVEAAREAMHEGSLPSIATPDADARIIGAALPPLGPAAPRKSLIIALGGIVGLLCGIAVVVGHLALDRRVHSAKELARELEIMCLGSIPYVPGAEGVPPHIITPEQHRFVAAIRDLRTSIEIACTSLRNETSIVIAVVGWAPGAGVSTLCDGLAQLISGSGRQVTLFKAEEGADASASNDDRRTPAMSLAGAAFAGLQPEQLFFEEVGGVAVLPIHSRDADANLFTDFRNPRVRRIVEAARARGDVLLDLPPLRHSMDALALASYADAVLVMARVGQTTFEEVSESMQLLRRAGANVIGAVVNRT